MSIVSNSLGKKVMRCIEFIKRSQQKAPRIGKLETGNPGIPTNSGCFLFPLKGTPTLCHGQGTWVNIM